jgi:hypothetical protein
MIRHIATKSWALCLLAFSGMTSSGQAGHTAGIVTWTVSNITATAADISTNGVLIDARNGANSDVTVNGVTFLSVANSTNLFDSLFANDNIVSRGYGTVVLDSNYRNFLQLGQRSGRPGSSTPPQIEPTADWATIIITGVTNGGLYQIQIWNSDVGVTPDGIVSNAALVLGNGLGGAPQLTNTFLYNEATDGGAGQYAIGTFEATGTNQLINVQSIKNLTTSPSWNTSDHFSNGWQVRQIPKPAPKGTVISLF